MTKGEKIGEAHLVDMIAAKTNLSKKEASEAMTVMLETVIRHLQAGGSATLLGLGTLSVTETKERQGVRPGTTERITVPAGKKVRFEVATTLKVAL